MHSPIVGSYSSTKLQWKENNKNLIQILTSNLCNAFIAKGDCNYARIVICAL